MIKRPFFIVGAERSGTTLLRIMLDHHPRLACHFEFAYSVDLVADDGTYPDLKTYRRFLDQPYLQSRYNSITDPSLSYPELVDSFLLGKQGKKDLVGATVHRHFDRLLHIWPDAILIHITRDGRDVARSRINMGWDGNVWTAIDAWIETERDWDRLKSRLDGSRYHEVRYEDLVAFPENELSKLCGFIGVEYSPAMLAYAGTSTYDSPDPNLAHQWKTRATPRDVQLMEAKASDMLLRRGYELSGFDEIAVTDQQSRKLERESRRGRRKFRLRRYGIVLMALDNLSRRLPSRSFRRYAQTRIEAVRRRALK